MSDVAARPAFHRSTRTRLAAATAGLVAGVGALILIVVYIAMRFLTEYRIPTLTASAVTTSVPPVGAPGATITPTTGLPTGIVVSSSADVLNTLLVYSACALVVLTILGAIASWLLAGRMLRPLHALSAAADLARRGSLSHRVGSTGRNDEFDAVSLAFDSMLGALERSFAASQRFAANASHEIRTPLATTKALLEVAAGEDNSPRVALLVDRLAGSNDRLIAITDALLDLATIGTGQCDPMPVDVSDLVTQELAELDEEIQAAGLRVTVRVAGVAVLGSESLLRLLIGNLLRNAVRHNHPDGHVLIEAKDQNDGVVLLAMQNSGDRIAVESLRRLAEPFFRVNGRTAVAGRRSGHGLGLSVVASVVDVHGGSLEWEARREGGLQVTVRLPAAGRRPRGTRPDGDDRSNGYEARGGLDTHLVTGSGSPTFTGR